MTVSSAGSGHRAESAQFTSLAFTSLAPRRRRTAAAMAARIGMVAIALGLHLAPLIGSPPAARADDDPGEYAAAASPAARKGYVGLFQDNAVGVFDTGANRLLRTIPVPRGPHGLVATPDGNRVYVSSDGDSVVSVIDTGGDHVVRSIVVGKSPHGLAITPDGEYVLAAVFGANAVVKIEVETGEIEGRAQVADPHNVAISPDGHTAYVASQPQASPAIVVLDIDHMTQVAAIPVPKIPRAIGIRPDGKSIYFTEAGVDAVQILDPSSRKIVGEIPVGASPHQPLFTRKGDLALVIDQGPGTLTLVGTKKDMVVGTVAVGKLPHWVATDDEGRIAYVTNEGSNDLSVVDLTSGKVTATIAIGKAPRKIVLLPAPRPGDKAEREDRLSSAAGGVAEGAKVSIAAYAFSQPDLTISKGESVTWINNDSVPHTVTSDDGIWDSDTLQPGAAYRRTFDRPGRYAYHCSRHPSMVGVVVVKG